MAPLLKVRNLKKYFPITKGVFSQVVGHVKAVDGISFDIERAQTYALVGESGCGKTTAARSVLRLIEPTSGSVIFDGQEMIGLPAESLRLLRKRMQIVFQDPYSSLNPRMTIGDIVAEPLLVHGMKNKIERRDKVNQLLERVGLSTSYYQRYPHEFSGGQRQRVGIARALALSPDFIVCDEAVSALDVSIQAQIINLLEELQEEHGIAYLFIAHDLAVVRHIADRVGVMYLGNIVEEAPVDELFKNPLHPYTKALMSAVPEIDPAKRKTRQILKGDLPRPDAPPAGCRFHTRCPFAEDRCKCAEIEITEPTTGHLVRCVLVDK